MPNNDLTVLVGGEAGQGLVTVGQLLTRCLVRSGHFVVVTQSYQSRIRGGHNTFAVRVSPGPVAAPREGADLLVAFDQDTVSLHRRELAADGLLLAGPGLDAEGSPSLTVPYGELAGPRFVNIVALGVAAALLGLDVGLVAAAVEGYFGKKKKDLVRENREALEKAFRWASGQRRGEPLLAPPQKAEGRLMLNGNEAIALGALAAGVKFCAFYPMTPSTSIALALTAAAEPMGLVVEQAEDEIAAVNMAIGASFAGAPSLVTTSGGGFALMTEGVSLAGMTETPLVIAVAQRPGPATGLPTRTEQGDLEFVLRSGHGEFPRAIYAPGSVEECFHLTRRAFEVAEKYQSPVFILTDQFLADSYRSVVLPDTGEPEPVTPGADPREVPVPYRRYAFSRDGVSPRLLPGFSRHLVVADSDEHTEEGHITEDHGVRAGMVRKRMKKEEGMRREAVAPDLGGDEAPDLLLVCWGSAKGAVQEAAAELRRRGGRVGTLHFSQVWPLAEETFLHALGAAARVIAVEGNATGQLARVIRGETGFEITEKILRYDGLPLTPEYILRALGE